MFGIRSENISGSVQIDSTYAAYMVIRRGVAGNGVAVPSAGSDEIRLVRPLGSYPIYMGDTAATPSPGLEYVIAKPTNLAPQSGERFGLQVFNSSHELVYDSGNKPIAPIANLIHSPSNWESATNFLLPPPSPERDRFIELTTIGRPWGIAWNSGLPPHAARWIMATATFSSQGIKLQLAVTNMAAPPWDRPPADFAMQAMVVDVAKE